MVDVAGLLQGAVVLVLWYGGSLVNKQELDVGILTGNCSFEIILVISFVKITDEFWSTDFMSI